MVSLTKTPYAGWPNCYRLSNGALDLVLTTDVGPRIIFFGFSGAENEFAVFPEMLGRTNDTEWLVYGGHRLWHAPEQMPRSYFPDNGPVKSVEREGGIRLTQPAEPTTGIQKRISLSLDPIAANVRVTHELQNCGVWPVRLAPWALSVMAPGGVGIAPLPPRKSHAESLLPAGAITLWSYTDMTDPRWTWGEQLILLRQDQTAELPQKVGLRNLAGWVAYARGGHLFVKTFQADVGADYPDLGTTTELFTNREMLEVETLGPMATLAPGAWVRHVEQWHLLSHVPQPTSEAEALANVLPAIDRLMTPLAGI